MGVDRAGTLNSAVAGKEEFTSYWPLSRPAVAVMILNVEPGM